MEKETAKGRYKALALRRDPFLRRAREFAKVTIPSLLPPEGHTQSLDMSEPYQGFGARCVTSLSSRLMTALIPPGQPWFKLEIPAEILIQEGKLIADKDSEQGLAQSEQIVIREIERRQWRAPTYLAIQHLIVSGNALEQILEDNTIRTYRLDQYVVARDPVGNLTEIVIEEHLSPLTLPPDLKAIVGENSSQANTVPLYTWIKLNEDGDWGVHQEINDSVLEDTEGTYRILPFNVLRWSVVLGEDYGRSKVEDHWGDFRALEGFSKDTIDGSAMAARNITMIRPNAAGGMNLRRRLAKARNGEFVVGNPEDVDMLQFKNVNGLQIAQEAKLEIKQELASAFLLNSSARRDAERVTAFELRMMIEEIESVLGGVYTALVEVLQNQRLTRLIFQMKQRGSLPNWPEGLVEPVVMTGLEALGREKDVQRVATVLQSLQAVPQEVIQQYVKWPELLSKVFVGAGLPNAVNTEAEAEEVRNRLAAMMAQSRGQVPTA